MEKGNEAATGGAQVMQTTGGSRAGAGAAAGGMPVSDPGGMPTDGGWGPPQGGGGGGSQADQEKELPTGEVTFPDGSRTRVNADGTLEHTDAAGRTGRWSGSNDAYYDPQTNEWMPEGWGDPGFQNREQANASDWEAYAASSNDARRLAQQAGNDVLASVYEQEYNKAVEKARELGASEGRR